MKNNTENKNNKDFKRVYEALRGAVKCSTTDLMTGETKDVGLEEIMDERTFTNIMKKRMK